VANGRQENSKFDNRVFEQFSHLDGRVGQLERTVGHVSSEMAGLSAEVRGIASQLTQIAEQTSDKGTPWGVLGTWSAVFLTLIGAIGYMALTPISKELAEQHLAVGELRTEAVNHTRQRHPLMQDIDELREAAIKDDERERIDQGRLTSLEHTVEDLRFRKHELAKVVTGHMTDGHPRRIEEKIDEVKKQLARRWSEEDRPQWERIRALERKKYGQEMGNTQIDQPN
jgi:hypothetical protein